jgi:cephalosporin hydroxylase
VSESRTWMFRQENCINMEIQKTIQNFNKLFYELPQFTWDNTTYMGYKIWKNPLDLWVIQEIIHEVKPDVIIETGTFQGGSALFYAHILDQIFGHETKGEVISIDINFRENRPIHERINYMHRDSIADKLIDDMHLDLKNKIMVILDSDHSTEHVWRELELYSSLVSIGSYLIVEDTNIGLPLQAVQNFLRNNDNFAIDRTREKFMCTFNPQGYLRRIK